MSDVTLYMVDAPHFCVCLEVTDNLVTRAPPICKYMVGWTSGRVKRYVVQKNWQWSTVDVPANYKKIEGEERKCAALAAIVFSQTKKQPESL